MPKKRTVKRRTIEEEILPAEADPPEEEIEQGVAETPPELSELLNELGSSAGYVILYKRDTKDQWRRIKRYEINDFSVDMVSDVWGGGDYLVKVFDADNSPIRTFTLLFDPRLKGRQDLDTAALPIATGSNTDALLVLVKQQADESKQMFGLLLTTLMEVMKTSQVSEDKIIEKLSKYKTLFGGDSPLPTTAILDMFKAGLDVGKEASTGGDTGSLAERLMLKIGENIMTKMGRTPPQIPAQVNPQPATPATPPQIPAAPKTDAAQPPADNAAALLAFYIPGLIQKAKQNKNPEVYADLLVEEVPPELYEQARQMLTKDTAVDEIIAKFPEVAGVRKWFDDLRAVLLEILNDELNPAVENNAPTTTNAADRQTDS